MVPPSTTSSSGFFLICITHSIVAVTCGSLIMFYLDEISELGHGIETAQKLLIGSTAEDRMLIRVSDSFVGLLLVAIGLLLFMVAFVEEPDFQSFFAKGCVVLHVAVAAWRIGFERRVEDLARDWPRQMLGDLCLALSWVLFLVYAWADRYYYD